MIVPENYPPTGSGGLGCGGDCACQSCRKGLGDVSSVLGSLWDGLTTVIPVGTTGIPVWVVVGLGIFAAASLMPKAREYRSYRR